MKKNTAIKILSILACSSLLASCSGLGIITSGGGNSGGGNSAGSSTNGGGGNTPGSSQSGGPSDAVTEYAIVDRTGDGISISLSKTKAKQGETITITVSMTTNYTLLGLYANKVSCTKVDDTTYTFVMGDSAVAITASIGVIGDVTISGDIAKVLDKQEDGSYKATITCENDTNFLITAGEKEYGYGAVDFDLSYADINGAYTSGSKATTKIALAGNGTYEVVFDASRGTRPISIYRTGILHAPSDADEIGSYFCGCYSGRNVLDNGAYNVRDVNHAEYRNSRTGMSYVWDLHDDGSLATATNILTNQTYSVYKSVKDNVYTVVDEYIESGYDADGRAYDRSKLTDTTKFSAKYAVVDEVDNSHYERTAFAATRDVETPSHELHSINMDIQYGYSVGFVIEDYLKACDRIFDAKTNEDGSFTTTVSSWKNYQDDDAVHTRYEYAITININKDGTLKSGTYLETYYTEDEFSFNDSGANGGSVKAGKEGKTIQSSSFAYTYGDPSSEAINFDTTPYFISSITNAKVISKADKTKEEGHVKYKEVLDESRREPTTKSIDEDTVGYTSTLHYDYLPTTALDQWQYGIISSDNTAVVGINSLRPFEWIATGEGTTEITIANHTTKDVTAKASVTVDAAPAPNGYYVWAIDNETSNNVTSSSACNVKAGYSLTVYLWGSPADSMISPVLSCENTDVKLTLSGEMVKPTASTISTYPAYYLTIDATSITTDVAISTTIVVKDSRDSSVNSKIALTINPGTKSKLPSSLAGTNWTGHDYVGVDGVKSTDPRYMEGSFVAATLNFSSDFGKTINDKNYYKGTLTLTASSSTYNFYYYYGLMNGGSYYIDVKSAESSISFSIGSTLLEDYGLVGIYAYTTSWSGADDITENDLIGSPADDDYAAEYEWFTLDA